MFIGDIHHGIRNPRLTIMRDGGVCLVNGVIPGLYGNHVMFLPDLRHQERPDA